MRIERYIYVGDLHSANTFESFIKEFDNWKTFFYLLWDLFDRWDSSAINFEIIKRLYEEKKLEIILWNHDLMFAIGLNSKFKDKCIKDTYLWQLENSGWNKTLKSFKTYCDLNYLNYEEYKQEVCDFLLNNFNIYKLDKFNNLLIHGWLPINELGYVWGESVLKENYNSKSLKEKLKDIFFYNKQDNEVYLEWIKRLDYLNKGIKELDRVILDNLSLNNPKYLYNMILDTYKQNWYEVKTNYIYESTHDEEANPLWFNANDYFKIPEMMNWLKRHLKKEKINKLIVWHQWFYEELDVCKQKMEQENIFMIDRSYKNINKEKGKKDIFWYMILDKNNKLVEIKEYWN